MPNVLQKPPVYDAAAFVGMRKAGKLAAQVLEYIAPFVTEGASTDELNTLCHNFIVDHGAVPAPLHYRGFPKSVCTSINQVVCHGIPGPKRLKKGDILNIDVTVIVDGWYGDTSTMFTIDPIAPQHQKLMDTTKQSLDMAIALVKPGCFLGDIGHCIQSFVESKGYSVVRDFCGHGIGDKMHMDPYIPHFDTGKPGPVLTEGMTFTIEPMVNKGNYKVKILNDGWTVVTTDNTLSAQWEHTILVTADGYQVLTLSKHEVNGQTLGTNGE